MAEKSKDVGGHLVLAAIIFGCCFIFGAHLASSRIQGAIDNAVEKMIAASTICPPTSFVFSAIMILLRLRCNRLS